MVNTIIAACPKCSFVRTRVVCTKRAEDGVTIRRRKCPICEHRWYSLQYPEVPIKTGEVKWEGRNTKYVPLQV